MLNVTQIPIIVTMGISAPIDMPGVLADLEGEASHLASFESIQCNQPLINIPRKVLMTVISL